MGGVRVAEQQHREGGVGLALLEKGGEELDIHVDSAGGDAGDDGVGKGLGGGGGGGGEKHGELPLSEQRGEEGGGEQADGRARLEAVGGEGLAGLLGGELERGGAAQADRGLAEHQLVQEIAAAARLFQRGVLEEQRELFSLRIGFQR